MKFSIFAGTAMLALSVNADYCLGAYYYCGWDLLKTGATFEAFIPSIDNVVLRRLAKLSRRLHVRDKGYLGKAWRVESNRFPNPTKTCFIADPGGTVLGLRELEIRSAIELTATAIIVTTLGP